MPIERGASGEAIERLIQPLAPISVCWIIRGRWGIERTLSIVTNFRTISVHDKASYGPGCGGKWKPVAWQANTQKISKNRPLMEMCGNDDFWLKIAFSRKIVQKSNKSHLPTGGAPKTDYDARNGNYSVSSFDLGPASSKMEKVSRRWSDFRKKDRLKRTFSVYKYIRPK